MPNAFSIDHMKRMEMFNNVWSGLHSLSLLIYIPGFSSFYCEYASELKAICSCKHHLSVWASSRQHVIRDDSFLSYRRLVVESPASSPSSSPTLIPHISSLLLRSRVQRLVNHSGTDALPIRTLVRCTSFWRICYGGYSPWPRNQEQSRMKDTDHREVNALSAQAKRPSDHPVIVPYSQRLSAGVLFRKHLMTCSSK